MSSVLKKISFTVRLSLLVLFLAGAYKVYSWSQSADPRFYMFLDTEFGRALSTAFNWQPLSVLRDPIEELSESEMTDEEFAVKRRLQQQLRNNQPSHRLVLRDGKVMYGQLVETTPHYVRFIESYGDSGALSIKLSRDRIDRIDRELSGVPDISYRDVKFQMEFPDMKLYKQAPYTILTDESYFKIENTLRALQRLHGQFLEAFNDVSIYGEGAKNIQVLFFSEEKSFVRYQRKHAPLIESGAGFFSPGLNRLVVFNHKHSRRYKEASRQLDRAEAAYAANPEEFGGTDRIKAWRKQNERYIMSLAENETWETVRHEGAHQLFYTYGIHSPYRLENDWLIEGLAVYCETKPVGGVNGEKVWILREALVQEDLLPLRTIVNLRSVKGLFTLDDPERISLAYLQSWSLVHYLMDRGNRDQFFEYLQFIRDPDNLDEVMSKSRLDLLCEFMGMPADQLEARWMHHIKSI